ncbi:uncharacterized protein LOC129225100 [Uloborus diversus]|uniref:uncharacterized protein LOC129225100 n=1 Tax=Uloborus diversus TaxID=327109 RepID=UPI00240A2EEB|nr:uncharacterized protein LOC129225100 [Uloborus diversus]
MDKKCEDTCSLKEMPLVKHTKANIIFLSNKLEHLKKHQPMEDESEAQVPKSEVVSNAFLDNYEVKNYAEGYSLWELKEDRIPSHLNDKICLENSVTDQVKSMQSLDAAKCSARKTKKPRREAVCKSIRSAGFRKSSNKHQNNPKDLHIPHESIDSFNHMNSVNHTHSAGFKSLFKPFDCANGFNLETNLNSREFNSNHFRNMLFPETLLCSTLANRDGIENRASNIGQCSKHVNLDNEHWRRKNFEETPENMECLSATRYLMKNLSSGSSETMEDDFDGFMENFSDFNSMTFKYGSVDNKSSMETFSSSCDEDSFAENAKMLNISEQSPSNTYINCNNPFRRNPSYFFPAQRNEMSFIEATDVKNNNYDDFFVPENNSALSTENDDNWLYLHSIKQEQGMNCQQKSLYEPINLEPYLPLTEVSTSFNFMNNSEF